MHAEDRLRKRIKRILSLSNSSGAQAQLSSPKVVDQVMSLFSEYRNAPKSKRSAVYAKKKEEILESLKGSSQSFAVSKGERR